MAHETADGGAANSSMSWLNAGNRAPLPDIPLPTHRLGVAMRDGISLDTHVFLPAGSGPFPTILIRTCYQHAVIPWTRYGIERYNRSGFAVVMQLVRGIGASEGRWRFWACDRADGYDAVEWVAAQAWCDGNVGMDGSSYAGMTQLAAAATRPPHLRAIVPTVPTIDLFRETPYFGGIFQRLHMLNWLKLISIASIDELSCGFLDPDAMLANPDLGWRLTKRPLLGAADGFIAGAQLDQFRWFLEHPVYDDISYDDLKLSPADYAAFDTPMLVVSGVFDIYHGATALWGNLRRHSPMDDKFLLVGPWDHGQAYAGGAGASYGIYELGEAAAFDIQGDRIRFFQRYLCGDIGAFAGEARARIFIGGASEWRSLDDFDPTPARAACILSGGALLALPGGANVAEKGFARFRSDPAHPVDVRTETRWDRRPVDGHPDVLTFTTDILEAPLQIVGDPALRLFAAIDAPDADFIVSLNEVHADGRSVQLTYGALRTRYRNGFDRQTLTTPGAVMRLDIPLMFVSRCVPAGHRLRLSIAGTEFPFMDPNPGDGGAVAEATDLIVVNQTVYFGGDRASVLELPVAVAG